MTIKYSSYDSSSGNIFSLNTITGQTGVFIESISGASVLGTSGVFSAQLSGATITGTTGQFTTAIITSGTFASGTAAQPSISVGTTANGIYSPSGNQIALSTSGTERVRIDSSGTLLIGTNSAFTSATNFQIQSSGGSTTAVINNTNGGNILQFDRSSNGQVSTNQALGEIKFSGDDGALPADAASIVTYVDSTPEIGVVRGRIVFQTANDLGSLTERLRITSDGRLGIGTNSPGYALTVTATSPTYDRVAQFNSNTANSFLGFGTSGGSGENQGEIGVALADLVFNTQNQERLRITAAGLVGIGTANIGAGLHVAKSTGAANVTLLLDDGTNARLAFFGDTSKATLLSTTTGGTAFEDLEIRAAQHIFTRNAATESARIDSSGRLLVGTSSSPSSDQGSASRFVVQGYVGSDVGAGIISLQRGVAATSITSGAPLGRVSFNENSGNAFGWIQCVADGNAGSGDYPGRIEFSTNGGSPDPYPTERMRINSNGNVNIGYVGLNVNVGLRLGTPLTGATSSYGVYHQGIIQPDTTTAARYFTTAASTAANGGTPYTIGSLRHFEAAQSSFNADSTVSNQYGFFVAPTFVGATNNYGFYSGIPVASGRWNFYAAGSAPNYFAGNVGIGTQSPAQKLHTSQASGFNIFQQDSGTVTTYLYANSTGNGWVGTQTNHPFVIGTNNTERCRVDASGRLLVGHSSSFSGYQLESLSTTGAAAALSQFSANVQPAVLRFNKSRGSLGTHASVNANDDLGYIDFRGSDGSSLLPGASIAAEVDGTPSSTVMPGRIVFSTNSGIAGATPTERMRISSAGAIGLSGANYGSSGQALISQGSALPPVWGSVRVDIQEFTSSGTWTKPTDAKLVYVEVIGGGGGGGSGTKQSAPPNQNSSGGGGGAGGVALRQWLTASSLGSTVSVTVGAGGAGGAAVTASSTFFGNQGTKGGNSSFGSVVVAPGGNGGGGGTFLGNSEGGAGRALAVNAVTDVYMGSAGGGLGYIGSATDGNPGYYGPEAPGGGGAGGGLRGSDGFQRNGGGGGGGFVAYDNSVWGSNLGGGGTLGTGGGNNGSAGANPGDGGGGGGAGNTVSGGNGGAGTFPGGGGGGGGTTNTGTQSGTGGAGANGVVRVYTYF